MTVAPPMRHIFQYSRCLARNSAVNAMWGPCRGIINSGAAPKSESEDSLFEKDELDEESGQRGSRRKGSIVERKTRINFLIKRNKGSREHTFTKIKTIKNWRKTQRRKALVKKEKVKRTFRGKPKRQDF